MSAPSERMTQALTPTSLEAHLRHVIPLLENMDVRVAALDDSGIVLCAPLVPNINRHGTAFGGSLASLATIAAWSVVWVMLEGDLSARIVIASSQIDYLHAVRGEFSAYAAFPESTAAQAFHHSLTKRRRGAIELTAEIRQGTSVSARFRGRFAAFLKR